MSLYPELSVSSALGKISERVANSRAKILGLKTIAPQGSYYVLCPDSWAIGYRHNTHHPDSMISSKRYHKASDKMELENLLSQYQRNQTLLVRKTKVIIFYVSDMSILIL